MRIEMRTPGSSTPSLVTSRREPPWGTASLTDPTHYLLSRNVVEGKLSKATARSLVPPGECWPRRRLPLGVDAASWSGEASGLRCAPPGLPDAPYLPDEIGERTGTSLAAACSPDCSVRQ